MEEKLYDALARQILLPTPDQYGNFMESPLRTAITKWAGDNSSRIAELVLKNVSLEALAEAIAAQVIKVISTDTTKTYFHDEEKEFQDKLNNLVREKVANELAERQLKKLEELSQ